MRFLNPKGGFKRQSKNGTDPTKTGTVPIVFAKETVKFYPFCNWSIGACGPDTERPWNRSSFCQIRAIFALSCKRPSRWTTLCIVLIYIFPVKLRAQELFIKVSKSIKMK